MEGKVYGGSARGRRFRKLKGQERQREGEKNPGQIWQNWKGEDLKPTGEPNVEDVNWERMREKYLQIKLLEDELF